MTLIVQGHLKDAKISWNRILNIILLGSIHWQDKFPRKFSKTVQIRNIRPSACIMCNLTINNIWQAAINRCAIDSGIKRVCNYQMRAWQRNKQMNRWIVHLDCLVANARTILSPCRNRLRKYWMTLRKYQMILTLKTWTFFSEKWTPLKGVASEVVPIVQKDAVNGFHIWHLIFVCRW